MDDLKRLREDKEVLRQLKEREKEAFEHADIVTLYDLLDSYLALDIEPESVDRLYQKILEIAFDRLAEKLSRGEVFDLSDEIDLYTARGVYEHALERWDAKDFKGANELFLVLSYLIGDDRIKKSILLSLGLTAQRESLDHFIENYVDRGKLGSESFFFDALLPEAEAYLKKEARLIESELEKIRKIAQ